MKMFIGEEPLFPDVEQLIECARRWYGSVKHDKNHPDRRALEMQLAFAVVCYERTRKLKHLKPIPRKRMKG